MVIGSTLRNVVSLPAIALMLASCGGGGAGGSAPSTGVVVPPSTPAPPPPPPLPPPPPPPATPVAFSPFNLSASQVFPVLGYSYDYGSDERGNYVAGAAEPTADDSLVLRYNASTPGYEAELPGIQSGRLVINATSTGRGYDVTAGLGSSSRQAAWLHFGSGNIAQGLRLQHSNLVQWAASPPGTSRLNREGHFAFGIPTLQGGIPATGTRNYLGLTNGLTSVFQRVAGTNSFDWHYLYGAGAIQFDFGTGAIGGTLNLDIEDFGREGFFGGFTLAGSLRAGSTTFQGTLAAAGKSEQGTFEGRFAGPDASEIIVRWRVPTTDPANGRPLVAFGAFAARMR